MKKINIKLKQTPKVKEFNKILKNMTNPHTQKQKLIKFLESYLNGKEEYKLAKKLYGQEGINTLDIEDRKLRFVIKDIKKLDTQMKPTKPCANGKKIKLR